MINHDTAMHSMANDSKVLRTLRNRVSFNETVSEAESAPENECEATTTTSSTTSTLKRTTPILFSTHRGLHLRVTSSSVANSNTLRRHAGAGVACSSSRDNSNANNTTPTTNTTVNKSQCSATPTNLSPRYSIQFCDLERWSTNRANTIILEDTFTIAHQSAAAPQRSSVASTLASNSLRFLPHSKTNSMRLKGYARFDVE